ncbi:hypothetical protein RM549_19085 [Salegentibacter sp. F188]|jgi:putative cell wall-binding protein|uniref:Uncharacterized protein n=1 Tax=Autumnicola patrickiae TaxID=3075591 RepID=A0ABU3E7K5_9FLAO|nr:hypothetical protein [Salegentibacter sp. F188]MDT0691903.1 hypothetical protein [Salegentibacter sp. F188]
MIRYFYIIALGLLLTACGKTEGGPGGGSHPLQQEAVATAYTVRLPGRNPEEQAILLSQTVYPATREDNAVGAIILAPQDERIAFMAMNRITHMPVNAPLLYLSEDNTISEQTLREMKRLRPDGVIQDKRMDVYAVNVPKEQVIKVREILGYKVRTFYEEDPVKLASVLDMWQAALKADHPDEVVISAIDHPDGMKHGLGPMGWNAHMGRGFAWVYRDSVPQATIDILKRRYGDFGSFMYLTGGSDVISDKVAQELGQYGLVRRISGPNVYASSAVNAGYKDFGRNWGWWWDWDPRSFGWGIAQAGHNYIIGNPDDLLSMIPAAVLGHMGKHGPILLVEPDSVPKATADYLKMVKPFKTGPQQTILNFAWIIGDTTSVSLATQQKLDRLLSPFDIPADTSAYLTEAPTLQEKKD